MWFNYNMIDVSDDLYAILEVSSEATQEEIKKAYHAAAKKYHPDIYHAPDSQQRFQKINAAYEILNDPLQRAKYDSFIANLNTRKSDSPNKPNTRTNNQDFFTDPVDVDNNLYTELDLNLFASLEEIKRAYKDLSEKYNPSTSLVPNAREKIRKITFAFSILSDPNLKERYDYLLRILVKFSAKNGNSNNQTSSGSTNYQKSGATSTNKGTSVNESHKQSSGSNTSYQSKANNNSNPSYTTSEQKTNFHKTATYSQTSYSNSQNTNRRETSNYNNKNNYPSSSGNDSSNEGRKIIFIAISFILLFYLLSTCSTDNKSSSTNRSSSNYQTTSSVQKTAKPTSIASSGNSIFTKKNMEVEVGKVIYLGYKLPDNKKYTYSYDHDYLEASISPNRFSVKGLKVGIAHVYMYNSKKQLVDTCTIKVIPAQKKITIPTSTKVSITRTPKPTATKKPTSTPTTVSAWSFETEKLNIEVGESVELHFSTPSYAVYTYIPEKYGVFSTTNKNSSTVIITGIKSGTGKLYLRNDRDEIVAECTITVSGKTNGSQTPTPLTGKQDGYTEQELIQNGYVGTKKSDGTMFYPGFYQAPNGNFYPTGN